MSSFLSELVMEFTVASSARPAAAFEISACLAMASISSDLFTNVPFRSWTSIGKAYGSRSRHDLDTGANKFGGLHRLRSRDDLYSNREILVSSAFKERLTCNKKIAAVGTAAMSAIVAALDSVLDHQRGLLDRRGGNGRRLARRHVRERYRVTLHRVLEHLLDPAHGMDLQAILDFVRNLHQVLHIFLGDQNLPYTTAARGEQLLLQSTDREHFPAQRDLAGHRHVGANGNARQYRHDRGADRRARARTVLRRRAFRQVDVKVRFLIEVGRDSELSGAMAHDR